jgi:hypothetical protein
MADLIKYPRTPHVPWSPGVSDDDITSSARWFEQTGAEVVVTEKMDGENTTLHEDGCHARSLTYTPHPSRHHVAALSAQLRPLLRGGWRVCGENMFAVHSVRYDSLDGLFLIFSVWDPDNRCLSWNDTVSWAASAGLPTVPVLWRGRYDEAHIRSLADQLDLERQEGYVVRAADGFSFDEFPERVGKWVRRGHVQTDQHWMYQQIERNRCQTA